MANQEILYLSQADVARVGPSMAEIIDALEVAFREKGLGRTEMPPKPGIHPGEGDNFIHAMPAYIPALRSAGLKWVSGYPGNADRGLPYIAGLLILNDVDTGLPLAVMDCVWITAMRTGAASAVATWSPVTGALGLGDVDGDHLAEWATLADGAIAIYGWNASQGRAEHAETVTTADAEPRAIAPGGEGPQGQVDAGNALSSR